ncbi:MAG: DUF1631 family protein [Pseudomonadota bacterium]
MAKAEKLSTTHAAELHMDGIPQYAGNIVTVMEQGLQMADTRRLRGKQHGKTVSVHDGAKADLVFLDLFDEEGDQVIVAVTIVGAKSDLVTLAFRNQVSEQTGTVLRLLKSETRSSRQGPVDEDTLSEFRRRSLRQLDKMIGGFVMATADHLFDLSGRPHSRDMQDALYETMSILKRSKKDIVEAFCTQIDAYFDEPLKPEKQETVSADEVQFGDLDLVDIQDFEDSLAIDRMVKEGQSKYGLPMEALTLRFAEIAGTEPLDTRLPVHVQQLCSAFKEGIRDRGIATSVAPELYNFFAAQVIRKLDSFYTSLNVFLRERNIRPDIDEDLKKHGSLFERMQTQKQRQAAPAKPKPKKPAPEPKKELPSDDDAEDLLAAAREAGLSPDGTGGPASAATVQRSGTAPPASPAAGGGTAATDSAVAGAGAGHPVAGHPAAGVPGAGHPAAADAGAGHPAAGVPEAAGAGAGHPAAGVPAAAGAGAGIPEAAGAAAGIPAAAGAVAGIPAAARAGTGTPGQTQPAAGVAGAGQAASAGNAGQTAATGHDGQAGIPQQPPPDGGMAAGRFDTPTLYRSVIDALNYRRSNPVIGAPGQAADAIPVGGTPGGAPATSDALASALTAIQGDADARTAMREQRSVRGYLSQNQADLAALEGTQGFEPASMNQLDLVDNLFTDISTEVDVTPDLRPIVGDLQIPLAKLALLEPQFFADKSHPARGVIDQVTQLASSSNYPNKALEQKVTRIIDNIVANYKTDSGVFQTALGELEQLVQQQQKALERNVERVVKTQDGQEKLRKAEKAVEKVLKTRVRAPKAPKPIVDLVNSGWRDLLKLTFVKQGPNSRAWKDYVKTLDLLSLWLMQKQTGTDDEQLQVERALEAEPLLDMVRQQISEALPTHVEHESVLENLKEVLAGRSELEYVDVEPPAKDQTPAPAEVRKKVEKLPRLRRWVRRVEDLERGTWLTYRDSEGARRRMQLAWISDDRDRFIFVNERGQKVADVSGVELARKLSRGVRPPSPAEELPLVDQSMYKTLEHVQKSLSFELNHDSLTRLINRETFIEQLEQALQHAKTKHATHALLYIDIDRFGIVNDVYDKEVGDQILMEFGQLLAQQHDPRVSSARIDGDCFGVLLLERSLEQAIAHAESIRSDIETGSVDVEGEKVSFTVSVGVASVLDHSVSVEEILEHGREAATEAKQKGGNRVSQYNEDRARADAYKDEEAEAIKQIEETLDTKNFVLQAQPIARTHPVDDQYEIEHYEILLAIKSDSGALQSPVDFIASAERFGFMTQVDQWVVRQVFAWISQMMDEQKSVPNLAINLSGNSVTDDEFMEFLFEAISEYGVGTSKICFEITETGTINNMVKATDFVNEFKNIGCKFSIDDFGTGLASHSYLRDLPVDYVKIDGTFIKHIDTNTKDFAMAKSINDLAHFLGQETIAEFAESEAVIAKLQEIGVDYIQGWGIGKPEPLVDLAEKLEMLDK